MVGPFPKRNARLYFQNSFRRKEYKTERGKLAWTRHPCIKLQIKYAHLRFKGIHCTFRFPMKKTILKNIEKYRVVEARVGKVRNLREYVLYALFIRQLYRKLCLFETFDVLLGTV